MSGNTFDAGGLIALDRDDRRVLALVGRATERGMRITVPAAALAETIRNPARQARLCRLIRQAGTDLIALDGPESNGCRFIVSKNRNQRLRRSQAHRSRATVGSRLTSKRQNAAAG